MSGDIGKRLQAQLLDIAADRGAVCITGGDTKSFLGRTPVGIPVDVRDHRGIISYEPKELVVTARCGTPLMELEAVLAEQGQMLGFEPPGFGERATVGGTVAAGLSGPRRPYAGSARDFVLGTRILNGRGQILRFGGEVMKNVAGYDLSRLMTGAMGTLGIIMDVSLKVLPIPAREITLVQNGSLRDGLQALEGWARRPLPLSASCADGERLYIRLSGAASAVTAAQDVIGGDVMGDGESFWREHIREQGHVFFKNSNGFWRVSVPATTASDLLLGQWIFEWGGGLRWLRTSDEIGSVQSIVAKAGGHATRFRGGDREGSIYQPLSEPLMNLHRNLKRAFDPQGLFNPGRLYPDL
ncbi:MAG: glycolate oxidase subunit GlcE [Gammaproteobacteria bacterium]|nr:glycolate oxidase subunit GlcE [Gammaproteobacteria bacterium]